MGKRRVVEFRWIVLRVADVVTVYHQLYYHLEISLVNVEDMDRLDPLIRSGDLKVPFTVIS